MKQSNVTPTAECHHCEKTITLRKDGTFRHHRSHLPEYPGSVFKKLCPGTGQRPDHDEWT